MSISGDGVKEMRTAFAQPQVVEVGGQPKLLLPPNWTTSGGKPADVQALAVHSLTGVVQYLKDNVDALDLPKTVVHVRDESTVWVLGALGTSPKVSSAGQRDVLAAAEAYDFRRLVYVVAEAPELQFPFGSFNEAEQFIIGLRTQFVESAERDNLVRLLASIKETAVREVNDNGISQEAIARVGVNLGERVEVPSTIALKPYRTFREVDQPTSLFVVRLRGGSGRSEEGKPQVALFEADGEQWKLVAIQNAANYLREELNGTDVKVLA